MRKADRHLLIKQLVTSHPIRTQEELLQQLKNQGVTATQATISRDIRDLKIVKTIDEEGLPIFQIFQGNTSTENEKVEDEERLVQMIKDIVINVQRVHFLTIVSTLPDNAHLFASILDELKPPHVVSTIAGFDTVVIISGSDEEAEKVEDYFTKHSL
ncbi:arginine repressor [Enterococcus sp. AZ194]|uniref:arginine repressor n=1 Tax=Enterococcus sp. AZ194 TaxID=2774629 RepID=UPI003F201009